VINTRLATNQRINSTVSKPKPQIKPKTRPIAQPKSKITAEGATVPAKKRPAWDVKGRLQDLEGIFHLKQGELSNSNDTIGTLNNQLISTQTVGTKCVYYSR
jgi:hypothetical protein